MPYNDPVNPINTMATLRDQLYLSEHAHFMLATSDDVEHDSPEAYQDGLIAGLYYR